MPRDKKSLRNNKKPIAHNVTHKFKKGGDCNSSELLHGGKNYKSVELKYNGKPVLCDICHSNNYYQRDSTLGRSKAANYLFGSVFGTLSIFTLFCNECGLARILKKENIFDKDNKIKQ